LHLETSNHPLYWVGEPASLDDARLSVKFASGMVSLTQGWVSSTSIRQRGRNCGLEKEDEALGWEGRILANHEGVVQSITLRYLVASAAEDGRVFIALL